MHTLTLSDEDFALLVRSMDHHAWDRHQHAAGIVRDGGSNLRHAKAVRRLADAIKAGQPKPRTTAFTRGGYSFRPFHWGNHGATGWNVMPKGERSAWAQVTTLYPASDGVSWVVMMTMHQLDARPSFAAACDLVMARLPVGGER